MGNALDSNKCKPVSFVSSFSWRNTTPSTLSVHERPLWSRELPCGGDRWKVFVELLDSQLLYVEKNYTISWLSVNTDWTDQHSFCNLALVPIFLAERCRVVSDDFRRAFDWIRNVWRLKRTSPLITFRRP